MTACVTDTTCKLLLNFYMLQSGSIHSLRCLCLKCCSPRLYYNSIYRTSIVHLTAQSGAPEMFEAEVGQRQVVFSWFPPPVTQRTRPIISYTLSCSPSPSSLPQSPSQSGPLTVAGFSPDTSYSCSVVANNGPGSGPPAHTSFTTLQDCEFVHLIGGRFHTTTKNNVNIIIMFV